MHSANAIVIMAWWITQRENVQFDAVREARGPDWQKPGDTHQWDASDWNPGMVIAILSGITINYIIAGGPPL